MDPLVICPQCKKQQRLEEVLIAQSNQNVIYECDDCHFIKRNIQTSKG